MFFNTENKKAELDGTSVADEFANPGKVFLLLPVLSIWYAIFLGDDSQWGGQARHLHRIFEPGE